jgi:hypothetical protein
VNTIMGSGMQMEGYRIATKPKCHTVAGNAKRRGRATLTSHDWPL